MLGNARVWGGGNFLQHYTRLRTDLSALFHKNQSSCFHFRSGTRKVWTHLDRKTENKADLLCQPITVTKTYLTLCCHTEHISVQSLASSSHSHACLEIRCLYVCLKTNMVHFNSRLMSFQILAKLSYSCKTIYFDTVRLVRTMLMTLPCRVALRCKRFPAARRRLLSLIISSSSWTANGTASSSVSPGCSVAGYKAKLQS